PKPDQTAVRRLVDQIHPEVFTQFPGYCWGKVICWDVDNRRGLEEATLLLRARPSKYQASIEALVRRARRGDALPPINAIVAIYNAVSLRFLLPVGGD